MPAKLDIGRAALANALQGESTCNYRAIIDGFAELGIAPGQINPRENVFTFRAWKALGRSVRKGQHGVRVSTFIPVAKMDVVTGERSGFKMPRVTTVFHISQTDAIDGEGRKLPDPQRSLS